MLLYDAARPNPRAVRMMLLEKGITVPARDVDVDGGENRRPDFVTCNPGGQVPVLVLDDGTWLAESGAIFQYLEEQFPYPPLIGRTPEQRAITRMWQRRVERRITEPLYAAFHYGPAVEMYRTRMVVLAECADGFKVLMQDGMAWLDALLAGATTVVPERFTVADIALFVALDFVSSIGWPMPSDLRHLQRWFRATAERPSARASLHPRSSQTGAHY
jgi:glutathione S-transferase